MTAVIIHVVMGTCGEYSDRSEWPVCWYVAQQAAQEHVHLAHRRAREIAAMIEKAGLDRFQVHDDPQYKNEFDPDMKTDYTGTDYFIYNVTEGTLPDTARGLKV